MSIESHIVTINSHMDAIATSSREQSLGLAEVNTAVGQMDKVTQQNAAMVEESTAASVALAGEAARLRNLVEHFQLDCFSEKISVSDRPAISLVATKHSPPASPVPLMAKRIAMAFR